MGSEDGMIEWMNSPEYQEQAERQQREHEEMYWKMHPESPLNKRKYRAHIANKYMLYSEVMEKSYLFRFTGNGHEYLFKNLQISLREKRLYN